MQVYQKNSKGFWESLYSTTQNKIGEHLGSTILLLSIRHVSVD